MKYTVLMLRPDYAADTFGQDTYTSHVQSETPLGAQYLAQREVARLDGYDDTPEDYFVLAVFEGELNDVKVG